MKLEVVEGPIKSGKRPSRPKFRTAKSGEITVRVRIIDADSPTFGAEFQDAFAANVRRARKANKQVKIGA